MYNKKQLWPCNTNHLNLASVIAILNYLLQTGQMQLPPNISVSTAVPPKTF